MDLNHLHLHVTDVSQAAAFYERYFDFTEHTWHGSMLFMRNEQAFDLALAPHPDRHEFPAWFHFGFRLPSADDVQRLFDQMAASNVNLPRSLERFEDFVTFTCTDPDGHRIEVYWE